MDRAFIAYPHEVRGFLDGRQTRITRIVKPQPKMVRGAGPFYRPHVQTDPLIWLALHGDRVHKFIRAPFAVGDRLWCREACADEHPLAIQEGRFSQPGRAGIPGPPAVAYRTIYRVDGEPRQIWRNDSGTHPYFTLSGPADEIAARYPTVCSNYTRGNGIGIHWTQAQHMPRWASRLTLTVGDDLVCRRVQDVSEEEARAEGLTTVTKDGKLWKWGMADSDGLPGNDDHGWHWCDWQTDPRAAFARLWNSLHGPDAWTRNDWVFSASVTVEPRNIDQHEDPSR